MQNIDIVAIATILTLAVIFTWTFTQDKNKK
jgi:predicted negative regulator of RcsB-dependent stress response